MSPLRETVMDADLFNPIFTDENKAREWLEARVWADGRACPHCGVFDQSTLMHGKSHGPGLYQCNACHEPFTVTVGTLYERSKIPLHKWLAATHLIMASKKGMSALQIGRMLGVSKKTALGFFAIAFAHRYKKQVRSAAPQRSRERRNGVRRQIQKPRPCQERAEEAHCLDASAL